MDEHQARARVAARIAKRVVHQDPPPASKLTTPCWIFQGATDSDGYGQISVAGKTKQTHFASWEAAWNRPVPEGQEVDHICRVRACCNPDHLEVVTHQENVRRMNEAQAAEKRGAPSSVTPEEKRARIAEIARLKAAFIDESPLPAGAMKEALAEECARTLVQNRILSERELGGEYMSGDQERRLASGPSNIKRMLSELGLDSKKKPRRQRVGFINPE